jgi:cell wall-associated NlpC family hydrolase
MSGEAVIARARALIGTRFRPQGRSGAGLDCIGLVAVACGVTDPPWGYGLRGGSYAVLARGLRAAGLRPRRIMRPGDVLAFRSGPGQLHLGIWTGIGIVHADATLRKVVERPGTPPWPMLGIWRQGGRR